MTYEKQRRIRQAYKDWIGPGLVARGAEFAFVTLTLKDGDWRDDGTWEKFTIPAVTSNVRCFLKKLNRQIFGNAHRRFGKEHCKQLATLDVIEGGWRNQLHPQSKEANQSRQIR